MTMQAYQQRVVEEKAELDRKIYALSAFIKTDSFQAIDADERHRMLHQALVMREYQTILDCRIFHFQLQNEASHA